MAAKKASADLKAFTFKPSTGPRTPATKMAAGRGESASAAEVGGNGGGPSEIQALRADLQGWFEASRQDFESLKSEVHSWLQEVRGDLAGLGSRLEEVETQFEEHVGQCALVEQRLDSLSQLQEEVWQKVEDLENRSRRANLRIRGLPEQEGSVNYLLLAEEFCAAVLQRAEVAMDSVCLRVERAHRALGPRRDNQPRDVLMCLHEYRTKELVLAAARKLGRIRWHEAEVEVYADISGITMRKRRAYQQVTKKLRDENVRYRWLFPVGLQYSLNGKAYAVHSVEAAIESMQQVGWSDIPSLPLTATDDPAKSGAQRPSHLQWSRAAGGDKRLRRQRPSRTQSTVDT